MRRIEFVVSAVLCCAAIAGAQSASTGQSGQAAPPAGAATSLSPELAAKMQQGGQAFQRGDFPSAIQLYREVLAAQPDNVVAHNMVGNSALRMKDFATAAASFKRALELMPDEPHNLSGLAETYGGGGMTAELDSLAEHIRSLKGTGKLPVNFCFVREVIRQPDQTIEVQEFPDKTSGYHFRYRFNMFDPQGRLVSRIALESDDIDQVSFAKEHPKEAAEGQRRFSLDSYKQNAHGLIRFYDGEPRYEDLKAAVLTGAQKPVISTQYGAQPAPAAPPTKPAAPPPQ